MILQVIKPEKESFDLPITLPKSYLRKDVHCLFYIEEEAKNIIVPASSEKKPSDFFGIFNQEESEKFEKHIQQIRND
jgi:hypothetical protein